MVLTSPSVGPNQRKERAYVRLPAPLTFPVEELVPETGRHLLMRTALYLSVRYAFRDRAIVTSEQFVYWDPTDPRQCLSPDLAVRLGDPRGPLDIWKTWELGAPELCVEIVSAHDRSERERQIKLERCRRAGIAEVVQFDPFDAATPLRLFDLFDGDLVERSGSDPEAFRCDVLGAYWTLSEDPELGPALRLARDRGGRELLPTPEEAERAARQAALARVQELEAELERRRLED